MASPLNPQSAAFAFPTNSRYSARAPPPLSTPTPRLQPGYYIPPRSYAQRPSQLALLPPFDLKSAPIEFPLQRPARPPHPSHAPIIALHPAVSFPSGHLLNPIWPPQRNDESFSPKFIPRPLLPVVAPAIVPALLPPPVAHQVDILPPLVENLALSSPATPPPILDAPAPPATLPEPVLTPLPPTSSNPPSTPKSPPPALTKSWASLLRSPAGSPSSNVSTSTTASPSAVNAAAFPATKKSLQEILSGVELTSLAPKIIPRGLVNNGNMCFANTILQCLVFSAPFWNLVTLIKRFSVADLGGRTPTLDAVILFLEEFRAVKKVDDRRIGHRATPSISTSTPSTALSTSSSFSDAIASTSTSPEPSTPTSSIATLPHPDWSEPFIPELLYDSLKNNSRFEALTRGHQEDAEEFLGFFLETLHEEILVVIDGADKKKAGATVEVGKAAAKEDGADSWLEVGAKGRTAVTRTTETRESPITKIFGGQIRSVLRCPSQKDSITLEPYQRLQLDIQPDNVKTIEHALLNLTVPEVLPDFVTRSGLRVEATKQVFLETFPPVLILHLKRLIYDNVGGVQKSGKVVGYGLELEIAADVVAPGMRKGGRLRYQLYAVVYHHGKSASGGHYTVAVRPHSTSNSWIHIDDTHISPISSNEVAVSVSQHASNRSSYNNSYYDGDKAAYLLFYNLLPPNAPSSIAPTPAQASPSSATNYGSRANGVVGMKP